MSLKICAVTGGRADWGLMAPVLEILKNDKAFSLQMIVTGQHLMPGEGNTDRVIENQGFIIDERVDLGLGGDTPKDITEALGRGVAGFARALDRLKPDMVLLLGDRYEIFGAAAAALIARIPSAHMYGGDVTEGAIDESMRHAITKMAHLHFVTNGDSRKRVIQMGENPEYVYCVGSPGLDQMHKVEKMSREKVFESLGLEPRPKNLLITFHPVTLEEDSQSQCRAMLEALEALGPDVGLVFTGSNADAEGRAITKMVSDFAARHENACYFPSLGTQRYFNAMRYMDAMVGNSSSGLYEAPSFGMATVNIGNRQKGRLKAESVIDCAPTKEAVLAALNKALAADFSGVTNPYGDGHSAQRIADILKTVKNPQTLCKKPFFQLSVSP